MSNLEPIEPAVAVEMYLDDKQREASQYTVQSHRSRLSFFVEWCEDVQGIDNVNELTGRDCHRYRSWRREREDENGETPNPVTMKSSMDTLRVWSKWAVSFNAIEEGIPDKILSSSLDKHENERDDMLDAEVGEKIREHLDTYEHASREHVVFELIWRGLLRRGSIRAIDRDADVKLDHETPHIEIRHRPETDTPLKKKQDGERWISLQPGTAQVLRDYIEHNRADATDDHGREPLVTTSGRPHISTIQAHSYSATRPCKVTGECPHERSIDECDAASNRNQAYSCPSSKSPHAIRRGAITRALAADIPEAAVAQRANSSPRTLSKHYDRREDETRMNQRREYFDEF